MSVQVDRSARQESSPPISGLLGIDSLNQVYPFSNWAISWTNWLITASVGTIGSIVVALGEGVLNLSMLIIIAVGGELSAGIVLLIAARFGIRQSSNKAKFAVWCAAALARSGCLLLLLWMVSETFKLNPLPGIVAAAALVMAGVLMQGVISTMLYGFDTCKVSRRQLELSVATLRSATRNSREQIRQQQSDIAKTYSELVIPKLDYLSHEVDSLDKGVPSAAISELATDCGVTAREYVRQLSHKVAENPRVKTPTALTHKKNVRLGLLRTLAQTTPPAALSAVVVVCIRLPTEASWGGPGIVPRVALAALWVCAFLILVAWARRFVPTGSAWGLTYLFLSLVVFLGSSVLVLKLLFQLFATRVFAPGELLYSESLNREQAGALWLLGAVVAATLIAAAQLNNAEAAVRLEQTKAELTAVQRLLEAEVRGLREESARLLHGSVQGRLAIAGVLLRECALQTDPHARSVSLDRIKGALSSARDDLLESRNPPAGRPDLHASLADVSAQWRGLIDVTIEITSDVPTEVEALGEDAIALITEIAQEAVANASRHGQANEVDIQVVVTPSQISLVARDDGTGLVSDVGTEETGLGTMWIKRSGGVHRLSNNQHKGAKLEVVFKRERTMIGSDVA